MPLKLKGATSGDVTLDVPAVAGTNTITVPAKTGTLITTADSASVTPTMLTQPLTLSTAQNTTSGTSIDITGIPSWAKRITLMFNGVSLSGTSDYLIRLGTSGGVATTGYVSQWGYIAGTNTSLTSTSTGGFGITGVLASNLNYGAMVFTLFDASTNAWVASYTMANSSNAVLMGGGRVALSAVLDRIRITTANGTDTFDAGSVNIMYEG